ncbi:hypothetical protein GCM10022226_61730 [Sphaerisporangium flaviroseum]|uniref:Uncharacterized protein n=1 Tax=Sphaerisporangium flaviroseum TaxID=509199 RepID=A0ABP7J183_9ACTN
MDAIAAKAHDRPRRVVVDGRIDYVDPHPQSFHYYRLLTAINQMFANREEFGASYQPDMKA